MNRKDLFPADTAKDKDNGVDKDNGEDCLHRTLP